MNQYDTLIDLFRIRHKPAVLGTVERHSSNWATAVWVNGSMISTIVPAQYLQE